MRQLPDLPKDFLDAMCAHDDKLISYMAHLIGELQEDNDHLRWRLEEASRAPTAATHDAPS